MSKTQFYVALGSICGTIILAIVLLTFFRSPQRVVVEYTKPSWDDRLSFLADKTPPIEHSWFDTWYAEDFVLPGLGVLGIAMIGIAILRALRSASPRPSAQEPVAPPHPHCVQQSVPTATRPRPERNT